MPLTLPAIDRRRFLAGSLAASLVAARLSAAEETVRNPQRFVLMADTHIPSSAEIAARGVNMHDNLVKVSQAIIADRDRPAGVMLLGDCAYLKGQASDYALLVKLLQPIREAGLPLHVTLGNHDHRDRFWQALPPENGQSKFVDARHLMIVESPRANWFLLDTLDVTDKAPGVIGAEQLAWLVKTLDKHADKPALIAMHHNPDFKPMPGGLTDSKELFAALAPRKQVKALFFGHTHNWEVTERDGMHLVNLPPVAYVFGAGKPNGFVELDLTETGAKLRLSALDKDHAEHGKVVDLTWRT
ncbi:MAG TPA: metallophosphoesterase [Pirellulaceae bacterium]|nr:metallophosphoesterase [Pirellulaceae bacterium]